MRWIVRRWLLWRIRKAEELTLWLLGPQLGPLVIEAERREARERWEVQ